MREIKFRVWVEYEFEGKEYKEMCGPENWFLLTQIGKVMQYGPTCPPHDTREYKVKIPLFYTGLKDKKRTKEFPKGQDIYEGDIMNFKTDKSSPSGGYYAGTAGFHPENARVVEWIKDCWMVGGFRLSTQLRMYEVIGDIHQNPELLENQNED